MTEPLTTNSNVIPEWLAPGLITLPSISASKNTLELRNALFSNIFEHILDDITKGFSITSALSKDNRDIDPAEFLKWINKDHYRKSRYYEAQELGSEIIASELISIADGEDSLEDVQRSTLRVNTRKYLMGVYNRKRFGEVKQIEHSGAISITKALEDAQNRVHSVIEAEYEDIEDSQEGNS